MTIAQDANPRMQLKEAARELTIEHQYTLGDLIDLLGEVEELEDDHSSLMVIIDRGV